MARACFTIRAAMAVKVWAGKIRFNQGSLNNYLATGDRHAGLLQRGGIGCARIVTPSTF